MNGFSAWRFLTITINYFENSNQVINLYCYTKISRFTIRKTGELREIYDKYQEEH